MKRKIRSRVENSRAWLHLGTQLIINKFLLTFRMFLPFPITISLVFLLLASIGSAVDPNPKYKGKRKLDDTSLEPPQQSSTASQRLHLHHSGGPEAQPSHHGNEPQQQQESPRYEPMPPRVPVPRPFDLNFKPKEDFEVISISSEETISDTVRQRHSSGHIAVVPSDEELNEDKGIETSISLNQASRLSLMGLEEMPGASMAQIEFMTRNKNPIKAERDYLKRQKENEAIHWLNVELGIAAQNSSKPKWKILEAYGQYILWLEKILLQNQNAIRKSLTAAKEKVERPETIVFQIQIFELYIKNAEENEEYEKNGNKLFRVDYEEISKNSDKVLEQKAISDNAQTKPLRKQRINTREYVKVVYGKWIIFLILPKFEMKKPHDVKVTSAIDYAKKYTKSLREQFLENYVNELAHPPDFFENLLSTDQPTLVTEMQWNEELEKEELDSFKKEVMTEMSINNPKKVGLWLVLDAYRRDILWLEDLLLSNRHEIRALLVSSGKENLLQTLNLLLKSAETNRAYEHTSADIFKLTPAEIANDPEAKKIHDILQTIGTNKTDAEAQKLYALRNALAKQALYSILPKMFMKKMPNTDIKTLAFKWARQYRKILREDYLAAFQNIWKPRQDFMPHILKQLNGKSGTASISSTAGQGKRQKDKQKKHEH